MLLLYHTAVARRDIAMFGRTLSVGSKCAAARDVVILENLVSNHRYIKGNSLKSSLRKRFKCCAIKFNDAHLKITRNFSSNTP